MRKRQITLSFLAVLLILNLSAQALKPVKTGRISGFSEFESAMPPVTYIGNPIMKHGGWAGWKFSMYRMYIL